MNPWESESRPTGAEPIPGLPMYFLPNRKTGLAWRMLKESTGTVNLYDPYPQQHTYVIAELVAPSLSGTPPQPLSVAVNRLTPHEEITAALSNIITHLDRIEGLLASRPI